MEILSLEVQLSGWNTHTFYGLGLEKFTYIFRELILTTVVDVHTQASIPDYSLNWQGD